MLEDANSVDDSKDDDNDGIADVLQISNEELMKRKCLLFLRTVDPKRITDAIGGINAGFLAVAATLKMQFAKVCVYNVYVYSVYVQILCFVDVNI